MKEAKAVRCQCKLSSSNSMRGKCDHKPNACKNKAQKEYHAPAAKLLLCFGCSKQYRIRWHGPLHEIGQVQKFVARKS